MNTPAPRLASSLVALAALALAAGCSEDAHDHGHENEVITTVMLTFTPSAGGAAVTAKFDDPDGDGGGAPMIEPITLAAGMYDLALRFENRLETPAEDITKEIQDEGDEHQVFFTGPAVTGPASSTTGAPLTQAYSDMDSKGLPLGLANRITASVGTGTLTVTLLHMPPVNDKPVKTVTAAETVRASGFAPLGAPDVQVTFPVTVR